MTLPDTFRMLPPDHERSVPPNSDDRGTVEARNSALVETEFVHRFAARLALVAERNLTPYLRHKVEPEDITQSMFRTFFRRQRLGELEIRNWNGVWGVAGAVGDLEMPESSHVLQAQRRDFRREHAFDSQEPTEGTEPFEPHDVQPHPDEQASIAEVLDLFFAELEDDRTILAGHLAGDHSPTISVQVGSSEQTVRRRLQQMERRLCHRLQLLESAERERVVASFSFSRPAFTP